MLFGRRTLAARRAAADLPSVDLTPGSDVGGGVHCFGSAQTERVRQTPRGPPASASAKAPVARRQTAVRPMGCRSRSRRLGVLDDSDSRRKAFGWKNNTGDARPLPSPPPGSGTLNISNPHPGADIPRSPEMLPSGGGVTPNCSAISSSPPWETRPTISVVIKSPTKNTRFTCAIAIHRASAVCQIARYTASGR
jgi:hypothetical protein